MEQNGIGALSEPDVDVPKLYLRLLCPNALVPALIGKKGENVKRLRRESGATISVADPVLGCDERVVHIWAESVDDEDSTSGADALCGVFDSICSLQEARKYGPALTAATAEPGSGSAATSTAGSVANGSSGGASTAGSVASDALGEARMLVDSSTVGFLVGRGGATIKDTTARTGASVRILPKSELPACACVADEVAWVTGGVGAVRAALRVLASQLKVHALRHGLPPGDGDGLPPLMLGQAPHADLSYLHPALMPAAFHVGPGGMAAPAFSGTAVDIMFRLLAPTNRTGNIIGKGGEHVRRVRAETGARIKVFDPAPGSEERVVALTSSEDALSPYCAAQDALIRCVIALTADDPPNASQRMRLLTAQASVGSVLGKRGATVSQLRQETGASIKVLPADAVPPAFGGGLGSDDSELEMGSISSSGGGSSAGWVTPGGAMNASSISSLGAEEVIQVEGSMQQCVAALRGVATLLRCWQIRRVLSFQQQQLYGGGTAALAPSAPLQAPILPQTAAGMASPGSPGILSMLPSSLSPAQPSFLLPSGMHQQGVLLPGSLVGGPMAPNGQHQRGMTYIYHLNHAQVGAVLGKGGAHIAQIRNMSGARVQLQGESEGSDRVLIVAGQPEQCQAAHTMTNAFLSMGCCEPAYPEPIYGA